MSVVSRLFGSRIALIEVYQVLAMLIVSSGLSSDAARWVLVDWRAAPSEPALGARAGLRDVGLKFFQMRQ